MIFTNTELAARVEAVEASGMAAGVAAVVAARPGAGAFARPLAGGVAAFAGATSPVNKIAGLGFAGVPDAAEMDAVERLFFARGAGVQVELAHLADPAVGRMLTGRGYVLVGYENVLGREIGKGQAGGEGVAPGVSVRRCGEGEDVDAWIDLMVTGFLSPDVGGLPSHESFEREAAAGAFRDFVACREFWRYVAETSSLAIQAGRESDRSETPSLALQAGLDIDRLAETPSLALQAGKSGGGVAVGGATMRIYRGVAQLCGAATLPAYRRRGVQTALLEARLADAAAAGCDLAVVTTLPGSKSHQNVQRRGFEILYTRAVLVRSAP